MNFTVLHSIPDCAEGGQLAESRERDGGRGESISVADIMVNSDRVRRWLGATMCRAAGLGRFTAPLATSRRWFCLPYTLVLRTRRPRCGDTVAKALPASWTPRGGNAAPTDYAPTHPRAAGDGVSSRVSSTANRFAKMTATALSIAASSGGRAARCCRSTSNQSGHAAGRRHSAGY